MTVPAPSTPQPDPNVVLAAAETLGQRLDNMRDEFARLQQRLDRRLTNYRRVIVGLGVVALLSIVAIVVTLVVSVQSHHASNKATDALSKANLNQQSQIATCLAGNQARNVSRQSWLFLYDTLLAQPRSSSQSPSEYEKARKLVEGLRAKVIANYRPRDCSPAALQHSASPH